MNGVAAPHRVRPCRPRDTRAIFRLLDATFYPINDRLGTSNWMDRVNVFQLVYSDTLWVLERDGDVIGMVCVQTAAETLQIFLLAVLPQWQRHGCGRALIDFAETEARHRKLRELSLQVPVQLTDAQAFYQRLGFTEAKREPYAGLTLIVMTRAVAASRV